MLHEVFDLFKDQLNAFFTLKLGGNEGASEEKVVFLDGDKMDPLNFKMGAISLLLVNLEEENTLRAPDKFMAITSNGQKQTVNPEIRLNLYILFVARFKAYDEALKHLSLIIRYFQNHRIFDQQNTPTLGEGIERLTIELVTLPFNEQNEIWSVLRTTYLPSLLYKVKMIVYSDEEALSGEEVGKLDIQYEQS